MLKRSFVSLLSLALFSLSGLTGWGQTTPAATNQPDTRTQQQRDKDAQQAAKIKKSVAKIGTNTQVSVKLKSGRWTDWTRGHISEIRDDAFVVQSVSKGQRVTREFKYDEVKKVRSWDDSGAEKTAMTVGIAAAVVAPILHVVLSR